VGAQPGRGYQNAQALFWEARSLDAAKEVAKASDSYRAFLARYPVGYYSRAALAARGGDLQGGWVADPRGKGLKKIGARLPEGGDLLPGGVSERAAVYLRLGLAGAARNVLADTGEGVGWLRYWAGDYRGALKAAGSTGTTGGLMRQASGSSTTPWPSPRL